MVAIDAGDGLEVEHTQRLGVEAFGEGDGTVSAWLPAEDLQLGLEREMWLATDRAYKQSVEQLNVRTSGPSSRAPSGTARWS